MPIESGVQRVADLNPQWPRDADIVREGAAHLRLIKAALRAEAQSQVGMISLFWGTPAEVPAGWAICDGQNGTPDMRGRVPVGAGGAYALGDSGGAEEVVLTVGQLPAHGHAGSAAGAGGHNHSASTGSAGSHSHTGNAASAGAHTHGYARYNYTYVKDPGGSRHTLWNGVTTAQTGSAGAHTHGLSINSSGAHTHAVTVGSGGVHTHNVSVGDTGGGEGHSNMQPYRALYYIMRVEG